MHISANNRFSYVVFPQTKADNSRVVFIEMLRKIWMEKLKIVSKKAGFDRILINAFNQDRKTASCNLEQCPPQ